MANPRPRKSPVHSLQSGGDGPSAMLADIVRAVCARRCRRSLLYTKLPDSWESLTPSEFNWWLSRAADRALVAISSESDPVIELLPAGRELLNSQRGSGPGAQGSGKEAARA